MTTTPKSNDPDLLREAGELIRATLKELLEKKHLYQSMSLSEDDFRALVKRSLSPTDNALRPYLNSDWYCASSSSTLTDDRLWLKAPDVKLFCERCGRREAFNPLISREIFDGVQDDSRTVQTFVFSFLCQSCKLIPEVFLIRRLGLKLTICGRAPMEHIDVPPVIHKSVRSFYGGALLAFQSGQGLAGNFMLRTVIEQWTRQATHLETAKDANQVLDAYMESLPEDFRARFPSMRNLYAALSSDIHGALGDADLFERARAEILRHFEARRLFDLALEQSDSPE